MAVLDSTLLDYFLMHGKTTAEVLWLHPHATISTPTSAMVFADYQHIISFQINKDGNPTVQVEEWT